MKIKNTITIIIFLILSLFTIIIDWIKWDLADNSFMISIFFALVISLVFTLYFTGWAIINIFENIKNDKWKAFIPLVIIILSIALHMYFPYNNDFIKINYIFNSNGRERVIKMVENNEIKYYRNETDTFILPKEFRLMSHTGAIYKQVVKGTTKILFYVHYSTGKSSAIIYVSDNSGIMDGDFGMKFNNIEFINEHWYSTISTIN